MKDLLAYYNASTKNKVRVYLVALLGYLLLYLVANPSTYSGPVFRVRMAAESVVSSISQVFVN